MQLSTIQQDEQSTRAISAYEQRGERAWIQATIDWCLERVGMSDVTIRVERNGRFSRRMGDALVTFADYANRSGRVRFSSHALWRRASPVKRRNTVVHEVAHILAELEAGATKRVGHGYGWKRMMRRLGAEPTRCHTVNRDGIRRRSRRRAPVALRRYVVAAPRPVVRPAPVVRPVVRRAVTRQHGDTINFRLRGVNGAGLVEHQSGDQIRIRVVGDHGRAFFGDYVTISAESVR